MSVTSSVSGRTSELTVSDVSVCNTVTFKFGVVREEPFVKFLSLYPVCPEIQEVQLYRFKIPVFETVVSD